MDFCLENDQQLSRTT